MSSCPIVSYGIQAMLDASLTVAGTGLPVYYRVKNAPPTTNTAAQEHGFTTSAAVGIGGTTDILINPQPSVNAVSMFNIAQSMGKLNAESKQFVISDTFVDFILAKYPGLIAQADNVWDGFNQFVGLVYSNRLYNVVSYASKQIAGSSVSWILRCSATGQE